MSLVNDTDGSGVSFSYDANSNLISSTDENGVITKYLYNEWNQRIAMTEGYGTSEARATEYQYLSTEIDIVTKTISASVEPGKQKEQVTVFNPDLSVAAIRVQTRDAIGGIEVLREVLYQYAPGRRLALVGGPRTVVAEYTYIE